MDFKVEDGKLIIIYLRFRQYFNNTLVLVAAGGHGKLIKALIIINSYSSRTRRI